MYVCMYVCTYVLRDTSLLRTHYGSATKPDARRTYYVHGMILVFAWYNICGPEHGNAGAGMRTPERKHVVINML